MRPVSAPPELPQLLAAVGIEAMDDAGTFRVVYTARLADAVYVLHAFQKKTQATPKRDIDTAKARFAQLMRGEK
jgi:phage-related protein